MRLEHNYYVYILTNPWRTVLYTGVTNDLLKRVWQHKNKAVPGFTKRYNCDRLVYYYMFDQVGDALAAEKRIKGWARWKKIALIEQGNPEWNDLSEAWFTDQPPHNSEDTRRADVILSREDGEGAPASRAGIAWAPGVLRFAQDDKGEDS